MISNGDSKGFQPHWLHRLGREAASAEHRGHAAPFELLEHPADIRLRARGATLAEVFANAARGMMAYLFELVEAKPERWERIEITAPDREALLVDWLSELLCRATSNYNAYISFQVDEIDEHRLVARVGIVSAVAIDDIKAVTHHELAVHKCNDGWEATVTAVPGDCRDVRHDAKRANRNARCQNTYCFLRHGTFPNRGSKSPLLLATLASRLNLFNCHRRREFRDG